MPVNQKHKSEASDSRYENTLRKRRTSHVAVFLSSHLLTASSNWKPLDEATFPLAATWLAFLASQIFVLVL